HSSRVNDSTIAVLISERAGVGIPKNTSTAPKTRSEPYPALPIQYRITGEFHLLSCSVVCSAGFSFSRSRSRSSLLVFVVFVTFCKFFLLLLESEPMDFEIRVDDLRGPEIAALLAEHLECAAKVSP